MFFIHVTKSRRAFDNNSGWQVGQDLDRSHWPADAFVWFGGFDQLHDCGGAHGNRSLCPPPSRAARARRVRTQRENRIRFLAARAPPIHPSPALNVTMAGVAGLPAAAGGIGVSGWEDTVVGSLFSRAAGSGVATVAFSVLSVRTMPCRIQHPRLCIPHSVCTPLSMHRAMPHPDHTNATPHRVDLVPHNAPLCSVRVVIAERFQVFTFSWHAGSILWAGV